MTDTRFTCDQDIVDGIVVYISHGAVHHGIRTAKVRRIGPKLRLTDQNDNLLPNSIIRHEGDHLCRTEAEAREVIRRNVVDKIEIAKTKLEHELNKLRRIEHELDELLRIDVDSIPVVDYVQALPGVVNTQHDITDDNTQQTLDRLRDEDNEELENRRLDTILMCDIG